MFADILTLPMKVQVLQENLDKALSIASRFVNTRAQLPVLSNILIKTDKNKLTVSSTNLETSVSISIGAKIETAGEITLPARVISELVANLSSGQLDISEEKERVSVKSQGFKSVLSGMNTSDFPTIPQAVGKGVVKISSSEIASALDKVLFAVSTDETRPVLTGVLFVTGKKNSFLVATDGFRLSKKKLNLVMDKDQRFIVPKTVLSDLSRLLSVSDSIDFFSKFI